LKKGAAFSACQSQQNDAQVFVSFFEKNTAASREKLCSKRALAECICPERENTQFKSGQLLRNLHKNLWFERRNPGPKKPGNG